MKLVTTAILELMRSIGFDQNFIPRLEDAREWIGKLGIRLWVSPNSFSSSGGWAYSFTIMKEGKLLQEEYEIASSTSLTYEEALEEGLLASLMRYEYLNKIREKVTFERVFEELEWHLGKIIPKERERNKNKLERMLTELRYRGNLVFELQDAIEEYLNK